ncbi:MAG: hypothetical protein QHH15_04960 [Candidatus Thermoplasmatota archaeon]|nr:hypothetical protein [Candidatus Thermoplasmatota archaeon]
MNQLNDDPFIESFFNTPEKKAKWLFRIKIAYIIWIVFMIIGILSILIWFLFK